MGRIAECGAWAGVDSPSYRRLLGARGACARAPGATLCAQPLAGILPDHLGPGAGVLRPGEGGRRGDYTEDTEPQIADFIAGKYDGMALPIGSLIVASGHHPDLRVVFAIDESAGADAVVANPTITGIAGLRGKVIGTKLGGFGELFVERMLEAGGLTRAEVTLINTDSNLVPDQLRAGVIDAGQAWEPYVSRVVQAGGRILYTSRETPGLIIDTLQFRGACSGNGPRTCEPFCVRSSGPSSIGGRTPKRTMRSSHGHSRSRSTRCNPSGSSS